MASADQIARLNAAITSAVATSGGTTVQSATAVREPMVWYADSLLSTFDPPKYQFRAVNEGNAPKAYGHGKETWAKLVAGFPTVMLGLKNEGKNVYRYLAETLLSIPYSGDQHQTTYPPQLPGELPDGTLPGKPLYDQMYRIVRHVVGSADSDVRSEVIEAALSKASNLSLDSLQNVIMPHTDLVALSFGKIMSIHTALVCYTLRYLANENTPKGTAADTAYSTVSRVLDLSDANINTNSIAFLVEKLKQSESSMQAEAKKAKNVLIAFLMVLRWCDPHSRMRQVLDFTVGLRADSVGMKSCKLLERYLETYCGKTIEYFMGVFAKVPFFERLAEACDALLFYSSGGKFLYYKPGRNAGCFIGEGEDEPLKIWQAYEVRSESLEGLTNLKPNPPPTFHGWRLGRTFLDCNSVLGSGRDRHDLLALSLVMDVDTAVSYNQYRRFGPGDYDKAAMIAALLQFGGYILRRTVIKEKVASTAPGGGTDDTPVMAEMLDELNANADVVKPLPVLFKEYQTRIYAGMQRLHGKGTEQSTPSIYSSLNPLAPTTHLPLSVKSAEQQQADETKTEQFDPNQIPF